MSEITVGSVGVEVVPDARKFPRRVAAAINPEAAKIGRDFGSRFGEAAEKEMAKGVRDGLRDGAKGTAPAAAKQGNEYGGAFARALKSRLDTALKSLPDVKINADSTDADREIAAIREALSTLRDKRIGIDIDGREALNRVGQLQQRLERLSSESATLDVSVDAAAASAELDRLSAQVDRVDGRTATVDVDVDTAGASAQLALFRGNALGVSTGLTTIVAAAAVLGPALIPIGAAGAGAMAAIATGAFAAASGVGVLILALAPVIAAVQALRQAEDASAQSARSSTSAHLQMAAAMDAVESAQRAVASAEEDARIARVRAAEQIAEARRRLADAVRQAADDQVEAAHRVADAERDMADAQRDSLDAIEALNEARDQAARDMEDLSSRVANGALDEREAVLRLADAQQRLAEVQADPKATELERQRAQLAVEQAIQGLQDQRTELARLREEKRLADEQGIEGSDRVQNAHDRVRDSQERLRDSQRGVAEAVRDASETQRRSAERVAEAQRGVADAVREAADSQRRSAEAIEAAQRGVISAQRGVQQASQSAGLAGGAAMDKVREKMAALTPEGRRFVRFVSGTLIPALSPLTRAAQAGLLPGLQQALQAMLPVVPALSRFIGGLATVMGDLAVEAARSLGQPVWQRFFTFMEATAGPTMVAIARTLGNLATGFAGLLVAFRPVTEAFFQGLVRMSRAFAEFGANASRSESFQRFLAYIREVGPQVISTLGAVGRAFGHILAALAPLGPVVLSIVENVANFIAGLPPKVIQGIAIAFVAVAVAVGAVNVVLSVLATGIVGAIAAGVAVTIGWIVAFALTIRNLHQDSEAFRVAVNVVWTAVTAAIMTAWRAIQITTTAAWNVVRAVFAAIDLTIRTVLAPAFVFLWRFVVTPAWQGIRLQIAVAWAAIQVIFRTIQIQLAVLGAVFRAFLDVARAVWSRLSADIAASWAGIRPIFDLLGRILQTSVAPAFSRGVDAITAAWERIRSKAKEPVRFVIETILNNGLLAAFNKVAGYFGVAPVDPIALPKGFAQGGYISGPGGPRDDLIPAMLSDGEFVVNAAAVKKLGVDFLSLLNHADRLDISGDLAGLVARRASQNRFADGGLVNRIKAWLPSVDPLPYRWGGVGPGSFDCSGLVGEVWARITGHPSFRRYFTTSSGFNGLGFERGPGLFTMGVTPGRHMAGNLAGLGFEAASTASGIHVGPRARSVGSFPQVWHLSSLPGGGSLPSGEAPSGINLGDPLGSVRNLLLATLGPLAGLASNPFAQLAAAVPKALVAGAMNRIGDALPSFDVPGIDIPGFAHGGMVRKYDQGGYLPPGVTLAVNGTGRPEPVFTAAQFDRLKAAGRSGATVEVTQVITNPVPEVPSESLTRGLRKVAQFGLIPAGG